MLPVSDVLTLPRKLRPGPDPILSDSEMVTWLLLKELCGIKRDREWLRFVRRYWQEHFPHLPSARGLMDSKVPTNAGFSASACPC